MLTAQPLAMAAFVQVKNAVLEFCSTLHAPFRRVDTNKGRLVAEGGELKAWLEGVVMAHGSHDELALALCQSAPSGRTVPHRSELVDREVLESAPAA
eukprot:1177660-Prorocentrum_minimum.AAC.1